MPSSPWSSTGSGASTTPAAATPLVNPHLTDPDWLCVPAKAQAITNYNAELQVQTQLQTVAAACTPAVSTSAYDTALAGLTTYLNGLTNNPSGNPAWSSSAGDTYLGAGGGATLQAKWAAVAQQRTVLGTSIGQAQATKASNDAISTAAQDTANKVLDAINKSQLHVVTWASSALPALPNASYPAGYLAQTSDNRKFQVNAGGTAWGEITQAAVGIFGQLVASQMVLANTDNLIPNANSEAPAPAGGWPIGAWETVGVSSVWSYSGDKCRILAGNSTSNEAAFTPLIPVQAGEHYHLEAMTQVRYGVSGNCALLVKFFNSDQSYAGYTNTPNSAAGTWTKTFKDFTIPAGICWMQVYLFTNALNYPGDYGMWDNLYLRRMAGAELLVDGGVTAQKLAATLALLGCIQSRGTSADGLSGPGAWVPGSAGNAPQGFWLGGLPRTTTYMDGSTDSNCFFELQGNANFGGYKVATVNSRSMTAYNRILNGTFYANLSAWDAVSDVSGASVVWDALTSTSSGGCAATYAKNSATQTAQITQPFNCPPTNRPVSMTLSTIMTGGISGTGSVTAYLFNTSTGTETTLGTWEYSAYTTSWTDRAVDITSLVSGGGDFVLRIRLRIQSSETSAKICLDNVKIII